MTIGTIVALLLAGGGAGDPMLSAQLTIRQKVIIRVPARPMPPAAPIEYKEKGGPKCISAGALAGAQISPRGVDLLLKGGARIRARLSRCPPLDYYSGFYIRPGMDGRICQDRDTIRVRSGGSCEIDRFRTLVPAGRK